MSDLIWNERNASIAQYMYDNADKYGLSSDEAYIVGMLRNIGMLKGNNDYERAGAVLLRKFGVDKDANITAVYHQHTSPYKIIETNGNDYDLLKKEPMLCLMYEADMMIDENGKRLKLGDKLLIVEDKYGSDSEEYRITKEITNLVRECNERLGVEIDDVPLVMEIYQMRNAKDKADEEKSQLHYKHFCSLSQLEADNLQLSPTDYNFIYSELVSRDDVEDMDAFLENVFCKFNHTVEGFKGHSLSVSDIVVIIDSNRSTCYYVDDIGFKKLDSFMPTPEIGAIYTYEGCKYIYEGAPTDDMVFKMLAKDGTKTGYGIIVPPDEFARDNKLFSRCIPDESKEALLNKQSGKQNDVKGLDG